MLVSMKIQDFPNMSAKDRSKLHKHIEKLSKPAVQSNEKRLSNKELMEILARR